MLVCFTSDPVALDVACADAVNRQPVMPGSIINESICRQVHDHFRLLSPETTESFNGLLLQDGRGVNKEYELITIY